MDNVAFAKALRELADVFESDEAMTGLVPRHGIRLTSWDSLGSFVDGLEVVRRFYGPVKAKNDQNCFIDVDVAGAAIPLSFHLYSEVPDFPSRYQVPAEILAVIE